MQDAEFDELIEKSSLGTAGARQLRARTPQSDAEVVRQIISLRALGISLVSSQWVKSLRRQQSGGGG